MTDDFVYKFLEALDKNKADLVAIQPVLREFTLAFAYKNYDIPYHPGALKYYKEHNVQPTAFRERRAATAGSGGAILRRLASCCACAQTFCRAP